MSSEMRSYPRALLAMMWEDPKCLVMFPADILRALVHGPKRVRGELIAWHDTVQVWQDPALNAWLTLQARRVQGAHDGDDAGDEYVSAAPGPDWDPDDEWDVNALNFDEEDEES